MLFFSRPLLVGTYLSWSSKQQDEGVLKPRFALSSTEPYRLSEPHLYVKERSCRGYSAKSSTLSPIITREPESQSIMLRGNRISLSELNELIHTIERVRHGVRECQLTCNDLGDEGAHALANMLQFDQQLRVFRLTFNQVSGSGVKALADSLLENDTLEVLDLSSATLDKEAARALANMLEHNHCLRSLILELCVIGDDELVVIAQSLAKNRTLKTLDIGLCHVQNTTLQSLINALKTNNTLETVVLRGNPNLDGSLLNELNRLLVRNQQYQRSSDFESDACMPSRLCY